MSLCRRTPPGQVRKYQGQERVSRGGMFIRQLSAAELDALQARVDRIMDGERDPAVLLHGHRITLTEPTEVLP